MADQSRRRFVRQSALGIAALPLGAGLLSHSALAQTRPRLDPSSSNARALNYVEQAGNASDHPAYEPGQTCANCMFYNADTQGCQLFPQHSVASGGWCQSWTAAG